MNTQSSPLADAVRQAIFRDHNAPLPTVSSDLPHCTLDDIRQITEIVKQHNGSPIEPSMLYVSTSTSDNVLDLAESIPTLRKNPATMIRIVCNVPVPSPELREFKPGYYRVVELILREGQTSFQCYSKGVVAPLSFQGAYFGIAMITSQENQNSQKLQFSILFQVIVDPPIEDLDSVLFQLLTSPTGINAYEKSP